MHDDVSFDASVDPVLHSCWVIHMDMAGNLCKQNWVTGVNEWNVTVNGTVTNINNVINGVGQLPTRFKVRKKIRGKYYISNIGFDDGKVLDF